ncbi:MAG: hypothetical protein JXA46_18265 [Dehalococcoidales bacterium]|nr:hypothetical protein [Dehalococcoidales bacterium]
MKRIIRFSTCLILVALVSVFLLAVPAGAAGLLDQQQTASNTSAFTGIDTVPFTRQGLAQTFTAGMTGELAGISVYIGHNLAGTANLEILLESVDAA